jgi:adenine specific DNA methylase Mod
MATLNWIGKEAVVNHDKEVPFKLLEKVPSASIGKESKNLVIHGDNLEALKALMPFYKDKVKCIYIDPPYNTGNEGWVYNDKVNSPKIREWLEKTVKIDDLTRHDKWLCMMYPRLKLLRDLLSDDGAIFISIDDNELAQLKMICDDIFGEKNFIDNIITFDNIEDVLNNCKTHSEKGFVFERLFDIIIKFGF